MRDLVVLCADAMWTATLEAILYRHESLGLRRPLDADVRHIPGESDGGARTRGAKILRYERPRFSHALLVFDHDGCGDLRLPEQIQAEIDHELSADWAGNAKSIVVAPEVEAWIVGGHKHFSHIRGLERAPVREWLAEKHHWPKGIDKPADPKGALSALFSTYGAKLSSANYRRIMSHASLSSDAAPVRRTSSSARPCGRGLGRMRESPRFCTRP
jgi:hypothetical protein